MKSRSVTSVSLVLLPEAMASTLISLFDVLSAVGTLANNTHVFEVSIVSDSLEPVTTASGITIAPTKTYTQVSHTDIVIVPSLLTRENRWPTEKYPQLIDWLKRQHIGGAVMCSACSGIFPLLEAGLFNQYPVTCHWSSVKTLRNSFPDVQVQIERTLIVCGEEDRLIMSGAAGSWQDLILYLVNRFAGPSTAGLTSSYFLLNWHPEGQTPYIPFQEDVSHGDGVVSKAQAWIREHSHESILVNTLTSQSGLPERSFKRRFKKATGYTTIEYIQRFRVEQAKHLLEASGLPIDEIAHRVGYDEPAFFRRLFKRITSITPSAYRTKFCAPETIRQKL
tara:strand:- start:138 stop:1145 length:1008 start_codon:yes stop_codon:yes gene_type:complete